MSALEFSLPPELEAHEPAELRGSGRDDVRMIVSDRQTGESSIHISGSCRTFSAPAI
jgi:S-adenosylmethionine:tRNA ribosyltransferase-isomerase